MVFQCTGCEALTLQPLAVRKRTPDKPNSVKYGIPTGPLVTTNCVHCEHRHHVSLFHVTQESNQTFLFYRWADRFILTKFMILTFWSSSWSLCLPKTDVRWERIIESWAFCLLCKRSFMTSRSTTPSTNSAVFSNSLAFQHLRCVQQFFTRDFVFPCRMLARTRWKQMRLSPFCGTFFASGPKLIRWATRASSKVPRWKRFYRRRRRKNTISMRFILKRIHRAGKKLWADFQRTLQLIGDPVHVQL